MQASIGRRQMLSCADDDFLFSIFSSESSLETFKTMDSTRKHLPSKKGDYATDNINKHSLVGSFFFHTNFIGSRTLLATKSDNPFMDVYLDDFFLFISSLLTSNAKEYFCSYNCISCKFSEVFRQCFKSPKCHV